MIDAMITRISMMMIFNLDCFKFNICFFLARIFFLCVCVCLCEPVVVRARCEFGMHLNVYSNGVACTLSIFNFKMIYLDMNVRICEYWF